MLIPKLSPDHVERLEAPILWEEITHAIENMKSDKYPGPDGLTAEFYKKFKDTLLPHLQIRSCLHLGG